MGNIKTNLMIVDKEDTGTMTYDEFKTILKDDIFVSDVTGREYVVVSESPFMDEFKEPAIMVRALEPEDCDLEDDGSVADFILNLMEDGTIGGCVDTLEYNYETFTYADAFIAEYDGHQYHVHIPHTHLSAPHKN